MKKFIALLGILVLLILAWYLLGRREEARQSSGVPEQATQVDTNTVNRLVLTRHNMPTLVFEKDAGGFWLMVEPIQDKTNSNLLFQLEKGLAQMKFVNLISEREGQLAAYQIDDVSGTRVQAYADSQLQADVYLGKLAPNRQHVYARPAGSNTVYSATGGGALAALRTRDVDSFRDREILNFDPPSFDSVDVKTATHSYRLVRVDSTSWNMRMGNSGNRPANASTVDGFLRALGQMRASGFRPDSAVVEWDRPDVAITAWILGQPPMQLDMKKSSGADYWVRISSRQHDFSVFESVYKTFSRDPAELLAPAQGS